MYKMIREVREDVDEVTYLVETIVRLFEEDEIKQLFETAEHYIGRAIAALNDGKNPFDSANLVADKRIITALYILRKEENQDAHNLDAVKMNTIASKMEQNDTCQRILMQVGERSKEMMDKIGALAQKNPKMLARHLQKLQMQYGQAMGQHQAGQEQRQQQQTQPQQQTQQQVKRAA